MSLDISIQTSSTDIVVVDECEISTVKTRVKVKTIK